MDITKIKIEKKQLRHTNLIMFSVFFLSAVILLATSQEVENTTSLYCYFMPHLQRYITILLSISALVFIIFSIKTKNYKHTNFIVFIELYFFAFFLVVPAFDFHISQMCGV